VWLHRVFLIALDEEGEAQKKARSGQSRGKPQFRLRSQPLAFWVDTNALDIQPRRVADPFDV
jgi:hypothetical protein